MKLFIVGALLAVASGVVIKTPPKDPRFVLSASAPSNEAVDKLNVHLGNDGALILHSNGSGPMEALILPETGWLFTASPMGPIAIDFTYKMRTWNLAQDLDKVPHQWALNSKSVLQLANSSLAYACPIDNGKSTHRFELYWAMGPGFNCSGSTPVELVAEKVI